MADDMSFDPANDAAAAMSILDQEDQPLPEEEETPTEEEEEPPPAEEEEEEEEDKEETDEEREEREAKEKEEPTPISRHARPTVQDIRAKYPNFFKDFPDMKHSLFREQEYGKLFPTVEEARQAQDEAQSFSNLRQLVTEGTTESFSEFLKGVGQEQGALESMSSNFLPALYTVNRDLYFQVTQPVAVSMIRNAFKTGKAGNENLMNAALVLSQWAFGDSGFASGEKELQAPQPKQDSSVTKERQEFFLEKYNDTRSFVSDQGRNRLKAEIARGFDPNNAFPEFTRNLLIEQVIEQVGSALEKDTRHMAAMNSLWKKAHQAGYSGDWRDRLTATFLSGARAVMPAVRAKIRSAAMGNLKGPTAEPARKTGERKEVRGPASHQSPRPGAPRAAEIDWSKTSDLDFLNDKVTLKKR